MGVQRSGQGQAGVGGEDRFRWLHVEVPTRYVPDFRGVAAAYQGSCKRDEVSYSARSTARFKLIPHWKLIEDNGLQVMMTMATYLFA